MRFVVDARVTVYPQLDVDIEPAEGESEAALIERVREQAEAQYAEWPDTVDGEFDVTWVESADGKISQQTSF